MKKINGEDFLRKLGIKVENTNEKEVMKKKDFIATFQPSEKIIINKEKRK